MTGPHEYLRTDDYLGALVERHGRLELDPADDPFRRLVVSTVRQQVSMASAAATRERLFGSIEVTPEGVLAADAETLRAAGLSRQKAGYVRNAAEAFRDEYSRSYSGMDDESVLEELTEIEGVGSWTAGRQLLFSLGRPDVFPVGDLGARKGDGGAVRGRAGPGGDGRGGQTVGVVPELRESLPVADRRGRYRRRCRGRRGVTAASAVVVT